MIYQYRHPSPNAIEWPRKSNKNDIEWHRKYHSMLFGEGTWPFSIVTPLQVSRHSSDCVTSFLCMTHVTQSYEHVFVWLCHVIHHKTFEYDIRRDTWRGVSYDDIRVIFECLTSRHSYCVTSLIQSHKTFEYDRVIRHSNMTFEWMSWFVIWPNVPHVPSYDESWHSFECHVRMSYDFIRMFFIRTNMTECAECAECTHTHTHIWHMGWLITMGWLRLVGSLKL